MRVVIVIIIFVVAGVLAVSLISKLRSRAAFTAFARAVPELGLAPARLAAAGTTVAAGAVVAETTVLVLLFVPGAAVAGLASAAVLFAGFTAALSIAVRRGSRAGCHCFGASSSPVAWRHVLRSGFLCALAVVALFGPVPAPGDLPAPQVLVAVASAAVTVAALVWLDDLVWLFRSARPTS